MAHEMILIIILYHGIAIWNYLFTMLPLHLFVMCYISSTFIFLHAPSSTPLSGSLCLFWLTLSWAMWKSECFFSTHVGLPFLPLPSSHALSPSSLAVRVHQECVDLGETYRKKKQWSLLFSDWDNLRFSSPLCLCLPAGAMPATSLQQVGSRGRCAALLLPLLPLLLLSVAPKPGDTMINIPSKCEYRIWH